MTILGIDPGSNLIGYGAIESQGDGKMISLGHGVIKIKTKENGAHLVEIKKAVKKLIARFRPEKAVIEKLFFFKNRKTAIEVSQARGVMVLCLAEKKIPIIEIAPLELKRAITGYGRAQKTNIQKVVKLILNLAEEPRPDDAADALALAILGSSY